MTATLIGGDIAVSAAESVLAFCVNFHWQFEFQGRPAVRISCRPEPPAMVLDDRAYDREAHSRSLSFGREEGIKQLRHVLGGNADAGIANCYMHAPGFALARTYLHL